MAYSSFVDVYEGCPKKCGQSADSSTETSLLQKAVDFDKVIL